MPARHGGRTKGAETAFPQILRSFLPDRLRTRATLIPSIDFIARGNARGRHYLTWNYRDIVRKCLHRTEIISKLSFSFFFTSALESLWNIRSSLTEKNGMEKKDLSTIVPSTGRDDIACFVLIIQYDLLSDAHACAGVDSCRG